MTRREFSTLVAACAAPAPARVRVGAHCWVFAARLPKYDPYPALDRIFRECAEAGLDGLELMHLALLHDDSVQRVAELSKRHSLPVFGSSWSAAMWDAAQKAAVVDEAARLFPRIRAVGGKLVGVSVGDARRKKTPSELDAQADCLRAVLKVASSEGLDVNLHNHVYEVADGLYDLSATLERVPEAKLGPDFGWLYRAKVDPVAFVRRFGSRIVYAHLRNELANGKWPETLAEGVIDYVGIGQALRDAGFTGTLAVELAHEAGFEPTKSYAASFRESRQFVRQVMGY
jgi:sugar phosphate isomerase/epimerase